MLRQTILDKAWVTALVSAMTCLHRRCAIETCSANAPRIDLAPIIAVQMDQAWSTFV